MLEAKGLADMRAPVPMDLPINNLVKRIKKILQDMCNVVMPRVKFGNSRTSV